MHRPIHPGYRSAPGISPIFPRSGQQHDTVFIVVGLNEANYRLCINYIRQHQQTDVRGNDIISAVTTVPGGTATALSVTHW